MAIRVRLTNKSQPTKDENKISSAGDLLLSRAIYQRLGSLELCKRIKSDYENDLLPKEFKKFLDDIDTLSNGGTATQDVIITDEFLGDLGSLVNYSYSKDVVNIAPWINPDIQTEYRVLVDLNGGLVEEFYLTDGDEVLVSYTG